MSDNKRPDSVPAFPFSRRGFLLRAGQIGAALSVAPLVRDGLMAESREQTALGGSPNQVEAVMAQLQKRAPNFKDA